MVAKPNEMKAENAIFKHPSDLAPPDWFQQVRRPCVIRAVRIGGHVHRFIIICPSTLAMMSSMFILADWHVAAAASIAFKLGKEHALAAKRASLRGAVKRFLTAAAARPLAALGELLRGARRRGRATR